MDPVDRPSSDDETAEGTDEATDGDEGADAPAEDGDEVSEDTGEDTVEDTGENTGEETAEDTGGVDGSAEDIAEDTGEVNGLREERKEEPDDIDTQESNDGREDPDTDHGGVSSGNAHGQSDGSHTDDTEIESETPVADRTRDDDSECRDGSDPVGDPDPAENRGLFSRFRNDMEGPLMWLREMLTSALIVLLIGLVLFGVSGVWPPMVAVESGSMEPNLEVGDLVFVTEPGRFAPDAADNDIGVVTYDAGQSAGYQSFGTYGSVIIFQPPDRVGSPIIHRPMFHVEEGEDWYDRADEEYHQADSCSELRNCPAPHDGYITLGDNNARYDQATGLAEPVKAEWVTGVARLRVPYLGYIRLIATGQAEIGDLVPGHVGVGSASADEMQREDRAVEDTPMESPLITESSMESPLITESPIKNRSSEGSFVGDDGQSGPIAAMETTGGAGMDGPTAVAS